MAGGLKNVGFLNFIGNAAQNFLEHANLDPLIAVLFIVALFYLSHYFFASITAHVSALFGAFCGDWFAYSRGQFARIELVFNALFRDYGDFNALWHKPIHYLLRERVYSKQGFLEMGVYFWLFVFNRVFKRVRTLGQIHRF